MKLPSNRLLNEIFGEKVFYKKHIETYDARIGARPNDLLVDFEEYTKNFSIYELMHLMKVWATKNGFFEIFSATTINGKGVCCTVPEDYDLEGVSYHEGSYTYENTEFEAVTQACEWILKQGGSDDTKRS